MLRDLITKKNASSNERRTSFSDKVIFEAEFYCECKYTLESVSIANYNKRKRFSKMCRNTVRKLIEIKKMQGEQEQTKAKKALKKG